MSESRTLLAAARPSWIGTLRARGLAVGRVVVLPAVVVIAWEAAWRLGWLPDYLVGPAVILRAAVELARSGELGPDILASLWRCYAGFCIGAGAGMALGLLAGSSRAFGGLLDPLVSLSYPVPKIAALPILMAWLGLGNTSKIATIAISVAFPVYIGAHQGARSVDQLLVWSARVFGAGRLRIFAQVVLPAALPAIFTGLRIGLAVSFILLFATEMVASNDGLGYLVVQAQEYQRFDIMFVAIGAIGLLGFISDRSLLAVERRLLAHRVRHSERRR